MFEFQKVISQILTPKPLFMAIDPVSIAALASAGTGLVKAGIGAFQTIKGARMKPARPKYERPEELKRFIERKQAAAGGTRYPGQEQDEERLNQLMDRQIEQARELGGDPFSTMSAVGKAARNQLSGQRDISRLAAQDKARRQSEADQALLLGAEESRKEFEINRLQPFREKAATKSALLGAGMQNITSGVSDILGAGAEASRATNKTDATSPTTQGAKDLITAAGTGAAAAAKVGTDLKSQYQKALKSGSTTLSFEEWSKQI